MQQVQIRFTASGANSAVGGFAPGDLARVPADMARHLVDEAQCAEYVQAPVPAQPAAADPEPVRKTRKAANPKA
jgi:hypothetical protein